ncbi:MAG TPA: FAD-dependent monooxygenase [Steroidobacteraceae bacterium]
MSSVRQVLIVGGGPSGMSLGICLRRAGIHVDLIDRDPQGLPSGTGLSLNGASLRAFQRVGVLERLRRQGHLHSGFELLDLNGKLLQRISPPPDPAGLPSGGGILRPGLHEILAAESQAVGVQVRLGLSVSSLEDRNTHVVARLTDGESRDYDLVVGADGLHSQVRDLIFPDAPRPRFTGQGCWRAVFDRPAQLDCVQIFMDSHHKAGLNPVSSSEMYMFLLEHVPDNRRMPEELLVPLLAQRLAPFGGLWSGLRAGLSARSRVNYRPLETLLLAAPWFRGRVALIGDAAHATTPHAAFGCGLAVEDALVLAEELTAQATLEAALVRFMQRRFERCRAVVEGSAKLGELEMTHAPLSEHQAATLALGRTISQPI